MQFESYERVTGNTEIYMWLVKRWKVQINFYDFLNVHSAIQLLDEAAGLPVSFDSPTFQQRSIRSQRHCKYQEYLLLFSRISQFQNSFVLLFFWEHKNFRYINNGCI